MPVVALTASTLEGDRQICIDAGMDDFLAKPLNPDALRSVLARYAASGSASCREDRVIFTRVPRNFTLDRLFIPDRCPCMPR